MFCIEDSKDEDDLWAVTIGEGSGDEVREDDEEDAKDVEDNEGESLLCELQMPWARAEAQNASHFNAANT